MLADAIELLDRRYRLAVKTCADEPNQILVQAFAFWTLLQSEPRLAAAYDDVANICRREIEAYRERDAVLARQLREIRIELARA